MNTFLLKLIIKVQNNPPKSIYHPFLTPTFIVFLSPTGYFE